MGIVYRCGAKEPWIGLHWKQNNYIWSTCDSNSVVNVSAAISNGDCIFLKEKNGRDIQYSKETCKSGYAVICEEALTSLQCEMNIYMDGVMVKTAPDTSDCNGDCKSLENCWATLFVKGLCYLLLNTDVAADGVVYMHRKNCILSTTTDTASSSSENYKDSETPVLGCTDAVSGSVTAPPSLVTAVAAACSDQTVTVVEEQLMTCTPSISLVTVTPPVVTVREEQTMTSCILGMVTVSVTEPAVTVIEERMKTSCMLGMLTVRETPPAVTVVDEQRMTCTPHLSTVMVAQPAVTVTEEQMITSCAQGVTTVSVIQPAVTVIEEQVKTSCMLGTVTVTRTRSAMAMVDEQTITPCGTDMSTVTVSHPGEDCTNTSTTYLCSDSGVSQDHITVVNTITVTETQSVGDKMTCTPTEIRSPTAITGTESSGSESVAITPSYDSIADTYSISGSTVPLASEFTFSTTPTTANNNANSDIERRINEIRENLTLEAKHLSAWKRKLTTAPDSRVSVQIIGSSWVLLVVIPMCVAMLNDIPALVHDFLKGYRAT